MTDGVSGLRNCPTALEFRLRFSQHFFATRSWATGIVQRVKRAYVLSQSRYWGKLLELLR